VHDVSFLEHPEYFTRARAFQLHCTVRRTVRAAACVLTPSHFSKQCILDAYRLDERKVRVVPNGVSFAFHPVAREAAQSWVRSSFNLSSPIILTVSDLQPRKNHLGLIRAFEQLVQAHPELPHHLVIVGKDTWYAPVIHRAAAQSPLRDRVHFTGFVSDQELLQLYGASDIFIYPSFYEGFGLPFVEAMACGRAVACSNTSAMPEVADSAAILFAPHSTQDLFRAMRDLLLNPELRMRTARLGLQRASAFSWERTAGKTLEIYYEVAGRGKQALSSNTKSVSAAIP
jgi:glycosyltransferase involved in cell wall biosynthesis